MENSVSTRTARGGDYVYLRTASPISVGGQIVVPVGSYVQGVVTQAKRSGRVAGRAELAIRLETLTLATGAVFRFSPIWLRWIRGRASRESLATRTPSNRRLSMRKMPRIAILAGSGAAIGGLADQSIKGV